MSLKVCEMFFLFVLQGSSFTPSSSLYTTNNSVSNPANYTATQQVPESPHCVCVCTIARSSRVPLCEPTSSGPSSQSRSTVLHVCSERSSKCRPPHYGASNQRRGFRRDAEALFYGHAPTRLLLFPPSVALQEIKSHYSVTLRQGRTQRQTISLCERVFCSEYFSMSI